MIKQTNDARRLMRAGCRVLLPFLILSLATFAYSQERPSIFLDDLTWTELRDEIATGKTTIIVPIGGTEQSGPAMALGKHNRRVKLLSERIAVSLGNAIVAGPIAWLKMLENQSAQQRPEDPMGAYDFTWLWRELPVTAARRQRRASLRIRAAERDEEWSRNVDAPGNRNIRVFRGERPVGDEAADERCGCDDTGRWQ